MKRTLALVLTVAACGDDGTGVAEAVDTGASTGPSTDGGDSSTASDATDVDEGSGSSGEDTGTTGGSSSGAVDSSSGVDGSSSGGNDDCLAPEILAALDQHAQDLAATAGLLATHPSQSEVTGFMLAPGLPEPPALAASFAGPLIMPCSEPALFDEFCEKGRCSQIECTGDGAGWINHLWIEPAIVDDTWSFEEVHIHLQWSGDSGTAFDITTTSTGPTGADMSLTGTGEMDVDSMSVVETFPALHVAGATVLEYADDAGDYSGELTIADVVVATADATGHLAPTGDCP